jgi:hypothetical protein
VTNVNDGIATLQLNQFAVQPAASKGRGAASTSAVEVTGLHLAGAAHEAWFCIGFSKD